MRHCGPSAIVLQPSLPLRNSERGKTTRYNGDSRCDSRWPEGWSLISRGTCLSLKTAMHPRVLAKISQRDSKASEEADSNYSLTAHMIPEGHQHGPGKAGKSHSKQWFSAVFSRAREMAQGVELSKRTNAQTRSPGYHLLPNTAEQRLHISTSLPYHTSPVFV